MIDCLLQSRRRIRELVADGEASLFEEHLHGVRLLAVREAILGRRGFRNDILRMYLAMPAFDFNPGNQILKGDYLDHRNPLTVGPVLDPPAGETPLSG